MYLQNKYTRWYFNIINTAKNRPITGYTEKHHIVPKSLGGTNAKSNIVPLTAREHFICHRLLTKMVVSEFKSKMVYALWIMNAKNNSQQRIKMTSSLYERLKLEYANLVREIKLGNKLSEETKQKISIANKGRKLEKINKPKSELWYKRHAETHKGKSNSQRIAK